MALGQVVPEKNIIYVFPVWAYEIHVTPTPHVAIFGP